MKIRIIIFLLVTVAFLAPLQASERELSQAAAVRTPVGYNLPPTADAERDFITYVGLPTEFRGYGTAPDDEIVKYEWDFDGDGTYDFQSMETEMTLYVYNSIGTYNAILRIYDTQGNVATDTIKVIVRTGTGKQEYFPRSESKTYSNTINEGSRRRCY